MLLNALGVLVLASGDALSPPRACLKAYLELQGELE